MKTILLFIGIAIFSSAIDNQNYFEPYRVENIDKLNTYFNDVSVYPLSNSKYIISSNRGNQNGNGVWKENKREELYLVTDEETLIYEKLPEVVNKYFSGGTISVIDEHNFYFSAYHKPSKFALKTIEFLPIEQICKASLVNGKWEVEIIEALSDRGFSYKHPSVSKDEQIMYVAADNPKGNGGFDLYVSENNNGSWSTPRNLGHSVNTSKDECYPFYHNEGKLFFASNGFGDSFGGFDAYICNVDGWKCSDRANLGKGINSARDEGGIYFDDTLNNGFISSSKMGGKGKFDFYKIYNSND